MLGGLAVSVLGLLSYVSSPEPTADLLEVVLVLLVLKVMKKLRLTFTLSP